MLSFIQALAATFFFIVIMPLLACGGFFLMMHGVNEGSDMIANAGLLCMPIGWLALYLALKSDMLI